MKHREAAQYLSDLAAGSLPADAAAAVARHAEACRSCAEWLGLYDVLAQHLAVGDPSGVPHPDPDLLALYGLQPEELSEAQEQHMRRHLESCAECRNDLQLARQAVLDARPGAGHAVSRREEPRSFRRWLAMAAGLAALLVCGALLFSVVSRAYRGFEPAVTAEGSRALDATAGSAEISVSDRQFDGVELVHTDSSLRVTNSGVQPGAEVTFSAGGVVAFGNGFSVARGGRITVTSRRAPTGSPGEALEPR